MRLVYRGNFQPGHPAPFSTESHIAGSFELLGHEVVRCQENEVGWAETIDLCRDASLFLWTSTHDYAHHWDQGEAHAAVATLNGMLPTAAVHLDLFHGLSRAGQVTSEPWFKLSHCFTADGDHPAEWRAAGVNHHWLPPAVYGPECQPGAYTPHLAADVAFVGAWQRYGHPEHWPARKAMLDAVARRYRRRFVCWPKAGHPAVRGRQLNDVLASSRVVVGDSCLASASKLYFSDRAFESVGRGGFTVFPYIEGLAAMLVDGVHVRYYPPGDHAELIRLIEHYLAHDDERETIRREGQAFVRDNHTYADRMRVLLATVGLGSEVGPDEVVSVEASA